MTYRAQQPKQQPQPLLEPNGMTAVSDDPSDAFLGMMRSLKTMARGMMKARAGGSNIAA